MDPAWQAGELTLVAAIEEECTGNGTLASVLAGCSADAALLLEPTDLSILLGGIGIVWVSVEIDGRAGHAEAAGRSANPILAAVPVLAALQGLEREMNAFVEDPALQDISHPYNVNVGRIQAGDWASTVPAIARLEVRVGHPGHWTSEQALDRVQAAITAGTREDPWLLEHPPRLALSGFRAQRHRQDPQDPLVAALAAAHADAHGQPPAQVMLGSTTDARFYLNQLGIPAVAYGPRTVNIHGTDEAVELASIIDCARTVARFLAAWFDPTGATMNTAAGRP